MSKVMKKVKNLTVTELLSLGRNDDVRNLEIVIRDSKEENKHFDVNIGGTFYGRRLFFDDYVEIEIDCNYPYMVEVDYEDGEDHNYNFETLEEAKEFALQMKNHYCNFYSYIGCKNGYNEKIEIEGEE